MSRTRTGIAALWILIGSTVPLAAQELNLDFSIPNPSDPTRPAGWSLGGQGYEIALDTLAYDGNPSLRMRRLTPGNFGVATTAIPPAMLPAAGSRVTLSGYIRTAAVDEGSAGLWLRVDGFDGQSLFLDNMSGRGATGTQDWTRYEVETILPRGARQIVFGGLLPGSGTAWFDGLQIQFEEGAVALEEARPLSDRGLRNVVAFTRLVGYVRYFHPSDQAVGVDWDAFTVQGMRAVEEAEGPEQLAAVLDSLFRPLAPTLTVEAGPRPSSVPRPSAPPQTEVVVTWWHFGLGGDDRNIYRSQRINTRLSDGTLPDSIVQLMDPMVLELEDGVYVVLPLAVYADSEGTLPRTGTPATPATVPAVLTVDDRATRLAGVATAWNALQHFFPYFDVASSDWNSELRSALQSAAEDGDSCEFEETLNRLVAALGDGHGAVRGGCSAGTSPSAAFDWIEGRPTVTHAEPASGLVPGDVILRVYGRPVEEVVQEKAALVSAATPQWERTRLTGMVLAGTPVRAGEIVVERLTGDTMAVAVRPRSAPLRPIQRQIIEEIEPGIWYVDLRRVTADQFRSSLADLSQASGIVFELRGYPSGAAVEILMHLITEPRTSAQWHIPVVTRPDRVGLRFDQAPGWDLRPLEPYLSAPKVIITDGSAISYAESIMGIFEAYDLATIVGGPTAGTNGNVIVTNLPGEFGVAWTGMKVLKHDGSRHHGIGIIPDVPVERTRAGVAQGRDEVLERALQILRDQ